MSAAISVFKLSVQNVHLLQQHTIEVSFKMRGLPYQWTPVANHSISIAKQSSARQCWSVLACISDSVSWWRCNWRSLWLFVHKVKLCIRLKFLRGYFLCQNRSLITCWLWKMHIYVQIVIVFECKQILQWNLQDIWPESFYENAVNLAKKFTTVPEICNFS